MQGLRVQSFTRACGRGWTDDVVEHAVNRIQRSFRGQAKQLTHRVNQTIPTSKFLTSRLELFQAVTKRIIAPCLGGKLLYVLRTISSFSAFLHLIEDGHDLTGNGMRWVVQGVGHGCM